MRETEGSGIIVRARGWILTSAALGALVLALAGPNCAQTQSPAPKSAPAGATASAKVAVVDSAAVTVTPAAKPKPAPQPAALAGQAAARGQQQGITVHGHWTIEVRNPDGTVDKHVEFDNSLVTTNLADMPGGPAFLYALLSGVGSFASITNNNTTGTGGWALNLQAPSGTTPASTPPCAFLSSSIDGGNIGSVTHVFFDPQIDSSLTPSCFITSVPNYCITTGGGPATDCNEGLQVAMGSGTQATDITIPGYVQVAQYNTPNAFTLSGTVTASQSGGTIGSVQALVFLVIPMTVAQSTFGSLGESFPAPFLFTSHTITPIGPITQGQEIATNVSFTFN